VGCNASPSVTCASPDLALAHTDRIVVLEGGRIALDAPSAGLDPARLSPYYEAA
jgi:phosphonate transport system ATP-binding protein